MPKSKRQIDIYIQTDVICFPHFATIDCPAIVYRNVSTQTIISLKPSSPYTEIVTILSENLKDDIEHYEDICGYNSNIKGLKRHVRFSDNQDLKSECSTSSLPRLSDFEIVNAKDCVEEYPNK